ncbi:MAG: hypothetical protein COA49_06355 [Bacteroidetes bacterium]|nr:MAG: hypothetical protein COA49_06355 [Bacteroidota bacterium]
MKFNIILTLIASAIFFSCAGDPTERNGLALEKRKKVFMELRMAEQKAGREALKSFPKPGTEGGGGVMFRKQLRDLQMKYWNEVLDSNDVATNLGDSIFTEGIKNKWAQEMKKAKKEAKRKERKSH